MENKDNTNNKKKLIVIVAIALVVAISLTGTFAWYVWTSGEEDVTKIVAGVAATTVTYEAGDDITGETIKPVADKSEGIVKSITLQTSANTGVTFNLYLDINSLDPSLKHASFKYALYKGTDTVVSSGDFATASYVNCTTNGTTHIVLASGESLTTDLSTYALYIWMDGKMANPVELQEKSFSFTLHADGQNAVIQGGGDTSSALVHKGTIPTGGTYLTGATKSTGYTYDSATAYTEGQVFPTLADGDKYTYGDFVYVYNARTQGDPSVGNYYSNTDGWLVLAEYSKTEYGEILESINGKSVKIMDYTFFNMNSGTCNVVTSPVIPSTITSMTGTFQMCSNLTGTVRINSSNVSDAAEVFSGTSKSITLEVPAGSTTYNSMLNYANLPSNVTLTTY